MNNQLQVIDINDNLHKLHVDRGGLSKAPVRNHYVEQVKVPLYGVFLGRHNVYDTMDCR